VFVYDGEKSFGAVRQVNRHEIVGYVENAGDFIVPVTALKDVHDENVVLGCGKLDLLTRAIGHSQRAKTPESR
jgi:hypothetical protein